jgi:hypothetical protein
MRIMMRFALLAGTVGMGRIGNRQPGGSREKEKLDGF